MPNGKACRERCRERYRLRRFDEDHRRGLRESRAAIETLQTRWPAAFPKKPHKVRPLAGGIVGQIMEATGWSLNYTRAVLLVWKSRDAYCQAVLAHAQRHDLAGAVTEQTVDDKAREQAQQQLAKTREARARRLEKEQARAAQDAGGASQTAHAAA